MDFVPIILDGSGRIKTSGIGPGAPTVVVDGVTKTVKTSGGDFNSIQDAVNWFGSKMISGACYIDVDPGTWSEQVTLTNLYVSGPGNLTLRGDQRLLAGVSWVDGAVCNAGSITNGGTGTVSLSNAGNNITVGMSTTNPDFDADGWGNGDKLLVRHNSTTAEYTISSVSNNVITLSTTAPAIGNDGTAVCLVPNRKISGTYALTINQSKATVDGFDLYGPGSGSGTAAYALGGSHLILNRCLARNAYYGVLGTQSSIVRAYTNCSFWSNTIGLFMLFGASGQCPYSCAVSNPYGYYATRGGNVECDGSAVGAGTTSYGFAAQMFGYMRTADVYARMNGVGTAIWSQGNSLNAAYNTAGKLNAATNYNPSLTGNWGASATDHGVIYGS